MGLMFTIGQTVWHKSTERKFGDLKVLEQDGATVFVELEGGAEMEFSALDLTPDKPKTAKEIAAEQEAANPKPKKILGQIEITREHLEMLGRLPEEVIKAMEAIHGVVASGRWAELPPAIQINWLLAYTGVELPQLMNASKSKLVMLALIGARFSQTGVPRFAMTERVIAARLARGMEDQ